MHKRVCMSVNIYAFACVFLLYISQLFLPLYVCVSVFVYIMTYNNKQMCIQRAPTSHHPI